MRRVVASCLRAVETTDSAVAARFEFPPDLAVFAGHFPGFPIVPGVFLLEAVRSATERAHGLRLAILEVRDAKFTVPVGPGAVIDVLIDTVREDDRWTCNAILREGRTETARIRLVLCAEGTR
jgi:3-hydroxyacyl-[acyl-carrier-protein] dehydratase